MTGLRRADTAGAPRAGHRPLRELDAVTREAIESADGDVDQDTVLAAWELALAAPAWDGRAPAWIHADLLPPNLLAADGRLPMSGRGARDNLPGVTDRETRRLSFGSVAEDYDRYRPAPPPQALDWLIPPGASTAAILDLAAGTGLVTRELTGRAGRVIAVEPDERMRAVLAARCPRAEVLAGRGEDIPLPDASVDAVVIAAAWHWLDPDLAVPEITRVLRPGGRLGVIWVSRDDRVPWVAEFNALARESREADRPEGQPGGDPGDRRRRRRVEFPPGSPLTPPEERLVEFSVRMDRDQLAGLLGTYSGIITLEPERRAEISRRVASFLDRQPWDEADVPLICRCLRSTRLAG